MTTVVWVAATYLTAPTDRATLVSFYRLVRPPGGGWEPIRADAGVGPSPDSIAQSLLGWVLGCLVVYAALFGSLLLAGLAAFAPPLATPTRAGRSTRSPSV